MIYIHYQRSEIVSNPGAVGGRRNAIIPIIMRIRVAFNIVVSSLLHRPWLFLVCSCLRDQYIMPIVTEASLVE